MFESGGTLMAPAARAWSHAALEPYETALLHGTPLRVCDDHGQNLPFDVARWLREPDEADETLLARCTGATLDVGCGPGRLVAALARRGVPALGVDVARAAVDIARTSGALALQRSVFERLPGSGRWEVALLADGNIGIGGAPAGLLIRLRELLRPGGHALIEVDAQDVVEHFLATVVGADHERVGTFPWARIGALPLIDLAVPLGYRHAEHWACDGRHFVALERR